MTLALFDVGLKPVPAPAPAVENPTDVIRRVEFKAGPWRTLRRMTEEERGNPRFDHKLLIDREYIVVELRDGRVFAEFTDNGERRPTWPEVTSRFIDEMLRTKAWREVSA